MQLKLKQQQKQTRNDHIITQLTRLSDRDPHIVQRYLMPNLYRILRLTAEHTKQLARIIIKRQLQ